MHDEAGSGSTDLDRCARVPADCGCYLVVMDAACSLRHGRLGRRCPASWNAIFQDDGSPIARRSVDPAGAFRSVIVLF